MVDSAESTRRLLGSLFKLEDLGMRELKGIAGPVQPWAVLQPRSVEGRFEALHATGFTALAGRDDEFELLRRRWARGKDREGQAAPPSGPARIAELRPTP